MCFHWSLSSPNAVKERIYFLLHSLRPDIAHRVINAMVVRGGFYLVIQDEKNKMPNIAHL